MAYFSNGSEGAVFERQCAKCKYGDLPCPIAWVQFEHNYEAAGNETASAILNHLVRKDGTCAMWEMAKSDFAVDPNQTKLF